MSKSDKPTSPPDDENKEDFSMNFFFPEDHLERTSPEETRIISLSAEPYEDGRRVRVNIEMSFFEKRPHLEVTLTDSDNQEVSAASFVEPMNFKLEFTLHLRTQPADGPLDLEAKLFYPDGPEAEPATVRFEIPPHRGLPQN
jgi:hypothetical protein